MLHKKIVDYIYSGGRNLCGIRNGAYMLEYTRGTQPQSLIFGAVGRVFKLYL